jgi:competence protein ComEC
MSEKCLVIFWDVQHGHATYVKTPNGRHLVIDLGTGNYSENNTEFSPLKHLKEKFGIKQLDFVRITHPHLDHFDDILNFDLMDPKVFHRPKQISNDEVMENVREKDRKKFEKYCEINNRYTTPIDTNSLDYVAKPTNWGNLEIDTFMPVNCSKNNFNNHSIFTVLKYAEIKIVIPGDNENCSFDELMQNKSFNESIKNSDVLLAPHHGRKSGFNSEFVKEVNPNLTVVSDGRFCDSSANDRYSKVSNGWLVHSRNKKGESKKRKCLTTNSDGVVYVEFGYSDDPNYKNFLFVQAD